MGPQRASSRSGRGAPPAGRCAARPWTLVVIIVAGCNVILGYDEGTVGPVDGGTQSAASTGVGAGGTGGTSAGVPTGTSSGTGAPTGVGAGGSGGSGASGTGVGAGGTGGTGGSGGAGAASVIGCNEQYGPLAGAIICNETADHCDVELQLSGSSCNDLCEEQGGECFHADCKGSTTACDYCGIGINCGIDNGPAICTCSRGCGSGPPCQAPHICNGGSCS